LLNFTVNELVSKIAFVLDNSKNTTTDGNITLTDLSSGLHNVTVYAWGLVGNVGASQTTYFEVESPGLPTPFPTTIVAASLAIPVVICALGFVFYYKKRMH
jgi:hypothetical protein